MWLLASCAWAKEASGKPQIKLYTMNCGTHDVSDMKDLSKNGKYDGQSIKLANPCFLIRHPKGDLLWETGLPDYLADTSDGEASGVWHTRLETKLVDQLAALGLSPKDINYLSFSHVHPDHAGNGNTFFDSTFIVSEQEHKYMFSEEIKAYFGKYYSQLETAETLTFKTAHDVFNDNTVVIKSMPGHTPGSSVLLLRLNKAGNVLLTGDLYTHARSREFNTMHRFNDKDATLSSRKAFERLAEKHSARVIIQHEITDFESLPKFPNFLY